MDSNVTTAATPVAESPREAQEHHRRAFALALCESSDDVRHVPVEGDVARWLRSERAQGAGALVWLHGFAEHAGDPVVTTSLSDFACSGNPVVVALEGGVEGGELARRLAARLEGSSTIPQHAVEGSLIAPGGAPLELDKLAPRGLEGDGAVGWLVCANIDEQALERASLRLAYNLQPVNLVHAAHLERANAELQSANARLARPWLGVWDAAAASILTRYTETIEELKETIEELKARAETTEKSAWENDQWLQAERRRNESLHYRIADAIFYRLPRARRRVK